MAESDAGRNGSDENGVGVVDGNDVRNLIDVGDTGGTAGTGGTGDAGADPLQFVKRGRGRPRKDGGTSGGNAAGDQGRTEAPKASSAKRTQLDLGVFATQIVGAHKLLALVTKNEVWIISEKEATNLALSIQDVLLLHKINLPPGMMAYGKLIGVAMAIYGPRLLLLKMKQDMEAEAQQTQAA